jgi:tetratricopeptide repeat protein
MDIETLRALNNLAATIASQGDLVAARVLLEGVIATTSRVFGEQHPDSLTAISNLAAVLWQEGDRAEAHALQQHVAETQGRLHGENSEAATAAAAVLAMMERDVES